MLKKFIITSVSIASLSVSFLVYSADNCAIEVAVSSPPIESNQRVAFNINNGHHVNRSVILKGGSASQLINNLPCSSTPLIISATYYLLNTSDSNKPPIIGQCLLKAGSLIINGNMSRAAVVFPNDFTCNYS